VTVLRVKTVDGEGLLASVAKAGRLSLKLELARIVANDSDIVLGKAASRFDLYLERELHLGARRALKLHHDGVKDGVKRFYWPHNVDLDRTPEPLRR